MGVEPTLDLSGLVAAVRQVHDRCAAQASRAVNISLTLRNWLIGAYLHECELRGADRASYGERLFAEVAEQLSSANVSNCSRRQLYRYARFFRLYPPTVGTLSPQLAGLLPTAADKADLPNQIFVSKYQLELPSREQIQEFVDSELAAASESSVLPNNPDDQGSR